MIDNIVNYLTTMTREQTLDWVIGVLITIIIILIIWESFAPRMPPK